VNTKDITLKDYKLNVMVYGASGAGKTVFGGTWPKPYFADFDGGMLSLRGIDVEYDTYQDLFRNGVCYSSGWTRFINKLTELWEGGKFGDRETIVIDSVTLLTSSAIWDIAKTNNHSIPTFKDYGSAVEPIKQVLARLKALPVNVLLIAHEELIKIEDTGELKIVPFFMGTVLKPYAMDLFDEVYRMDVFKDKDGKSVHHLLTRKTSRYDAKSRLGCLEEKEVPDYNVLLEKVRQEEKGRKEE